MAKKKEGILTCTQFCNLMKLNGLTRRVIFKRYPDFIATESDWKKELSKIGITF